MKITKYTKHETSTRSTTLVEETSVTEGEAQLPRSRPSPSGRVAPHATEWAHLNVFKVEEVSSGKAGEIRTRVRVTLSAWNSAGDFTTIPDSELGTILTLVDYDSGSALPGAWTIEHATDRAGHDERLRPGIKVDEQQSFDFWVTSTDPCPPSVNVAASILPPGGADPIQTRPGHSGSGPVSFDSHVAITTVVAPVWEITTFKLSRVSASDKAYTNGLQQIKFKIELAFTDKVTNKPGVPTAAELASLTIAFADGGNPLPVDTGATKKGWVVSPGVANAEDATYDKGYLVHPDTSIPDAASPGTADSPLASTFRYFYISNRGGSAQSVSLCAFVKCDDGWTYLTNGKMFDNCGGEHVAGHHSLKDVRGVTPEVGTIERYPWVRDILSGDEGGSEPRNNPDSVHRYTLSFVDTMGNVAGIRSMAVAPEGMIQWHDKVSGEYRACFTGYAQPGSTNLVWDGSVPVGSTPLPTLPSADVKQGVVVLVGRQDIAYASGKPNGPLTLATTDWYGNTNTLKVRFDSAMGDGRWKLVLYK